MGWKRETSDGEIPGTNPPPPYKYHPAEDLSIKHTRQLYSAAVVQIPPCTLTYNVSSGTLSLYTTTTTLAFPAEAGTHLPTPEGWKAELA